MLAISAAMWVFPAAILQIRSNVCFGGSKRHRRLMSAS